MRVTEGMRYQSIETNLALLSSRHAQASREALTGRRIQAPSTDPGAAAELTRVRSALSQTHAYRATIRNVLGDVEVAESALAESSTLLMRVREIAMQGANGSMSASDRGLLASEVANLKQQLVQLANTQGACGYLFAGSRTDTVAFDASGSFLGDDLDHVVPIGPGQTAAVNPSGARAFTAAGGRDAFADLDALEAALRADDAAAVQGTLDGLEASQRQLTKERGNSGLVLDRLRTADLVLEQTVVQLHERDQDVGGVDPLEAFSRLTQLGQSLENAVAVARTLLGTGLIQRF